MPELNQGINVQRQGIERTLSAPGVQPRQPAPPSPIGAAMQALMGETANTAYTALRVAEQDDIRKAMEAESQNKPVPALLTKKGIDFHFVRQMATLASTINDDELLNKLDSDYPDRPLEVKFSEWLDTTTENMPAAARLYLKDTMLPRVVHANDRRLADAREARFEDGLAALVAMPVSMESVANKQQLTLEAEQSGIPKSKFLSSYYARKMAMLRQQGTAEALAEARQLETMAKDDGVEPAVAGAVDDVRALYESREADSIDTAMLTNPELADTIIDNVMNNPDIVNKTGIIARVASRAKAAASATFREKDAQEVVQHLLDGATTGGAATIPDVVDPYTGAKISREDRINAAVNSIMPAMSFTEQVSFLVNSGATYEPWKRTLEAGARGTVPGQPAPVNVRAAYQLYQSLNKSEGGAGLLGSHETESTAAFYALMDEVVADLGDNPADPSDSAFHMATQAMSTTPQNEAALKGIPDAVKKIEYYKHASNSDTMRVAIENRARLYTRKYSVSADRAVAMAVNTLNKQYTISNGWWIPRGEALPYGDAIGQRAIKSFMEQPVDAVTGEPTDKPLSQVPSLPAQVGSLAQSLNSKLFGTTSPPKQSGKRDVITRAEFYDLDAADFALVPRDKGQAWDLVNMGTMTTEATTTRQALIKEYDNFLQAELRKRELAGRSKYEANTALNKGVGLIGALLPKNLITPKFNTLPSLVNTGVISQ